MHAVFGVELLRSGTDERTGEAFSSRSIRRMAEDTIDIPVTVDFKHDNVIGRASGFKATGGGFFTVSLYCDLRIDMDKLPQALGRCPCAGGKVSEVGKDGQVRSFTLLEVSMSAGNRDRKIGRLEIRQSRRPNR